MDKGGMGVKEVVFVGIKGAQGQDFGGLGGRTCGRTKDIHMQVQATQRLGETEDMLFDSPGSTKVDWYTKGNSHLSIRTAASTWAAL